MYHSTSNNRGGWQMSWKDELAKRFSNSHWWSVLNDSNHGRKGLINFIEKLLEKERKETEQRIIDDILKLKFAPVSYTKGLVTVEDIEQLREKYIKGE
jgi:hypothetical protein